VVVSAFAFMKLTDDYKAKLRLWAANPQVVPLPHATNLPRFASRKFSSHAEMNTWKSQYLRKVAAQGGCQWTS